MLIKNQNDTQIKNSVQDEHASAAVNYTVDPSTGLLLISVHLLRGKQTTPCQQLFNLKKHGLCPMRFQNI